MNEYNSFQEVIDVLNENDLPYLILRNYDNLLKEEMYMNGHGDVDMMVEDSNVVKKVLNAHEYPSHGDDETHYYVVVNNQKVSLDLRHVGDGYYCTKWQNDILSRRILYQGFYVMSPEDYFYSLIYHAIIQKPQFSEEYKNRLLKMGSDLGLYISEDNNATDFINLLEQYMIKNGYFYTYPHDIYVPLHTKYITRKLIERDSTLYIRHWIFDSKCSLISFAVKLKHLLTSGKFK